MTMLKTLTLAVVAIAITAFDTTPADARGGGIGNGTSYNGASAGFGNGVSVNGLWENGSTFQGVKYNGYQTQGVSHNGQGAQGLKYNGYHTQGVSYNGVTTSLGGQVVGIEFPAPADTAK
jgi:hypothetical protein